jgi:hypothetical protein
MPSATQWMVVAGCGGGGGSGSAAAAVAPAAISSSSTTPLGAQVLDPTLVPSGPSDAAWYHRMDDPRTAENEAARDLARAIAGNGLGEQAVFDHLTRGGGLAIFVGGLNHERDDPTHRSGWIVAYAPHVHGALGLPSIQVDYLEPSAATGVDPLQLALYIASFKEGVLRTIGLVRKALSAGAGEVRLYGHSKGGDIVQEVTWLEHEEPRLTFAVALGIPLWSAATPEPDPTGPFERGGMFHRGRWNARDYGGKLVVFNRLSDRISHGALWPPANLPGPGHDYATILQDPAFRDLLERAVFQTPVGWEDRSLGKTYDR